MFFSKLRKRASSIDSRAGCVFEWDDDTHSHGHWVNFAFNNVSKVVVMKFIIDSGRFDGQAGTVSVASTADTTRCLIGGLDHISGPSEIVCGI